MRPFTPTAEDLPCDEQLIVDGILVSCWSWEGHPELYSGKHHTTGLNPSCLQSGGPAVLDLRPGRGLPPRQCGVARLGRLGRD
jgi:hypothetical protein